ncbi:MAG: hypothetical protein GF398_03795 [Chitinivibrionales bacterium]|nr:hypothetical protein [Chitinivibrionales bacterium]
MTFKFGNWHGGDCYVGLHYDLHALPSDPDLGKRTSTPDLLPQFEQLNVDFYQTDCKGHPGYTSWFSKTPEASIAGGMKKDALAGWRNATSKLNKPLHCHYSGIWDRAATERHPEWSVVSKFKDVPMDPNGQNAGAPPEQIICPRSPYLEELMIPQMLELIDNYDVDGFWIDGDLWAVVPCYCKRCTAAFREQTGIKKPPVSEKDTNWTTWINFVRESFEEFVTRYCDAVHNHKSGILVCSNWLQTFRNPGEPRVPTDWISGDNTWVFGLDDSRCEARFISTRGKHWDIMLWAFYKMYAMTDMKSPWVAKPPQMLQQEAAVVTALGGSIQIYENSFGVRDGRLIPWHVEDIKKTIQFVKKRQKFCQHTETIPQIVVLHSEHHARAHMGHNLMWGVDLTSVRGATLALLENHYGVDLMDEWALRQHLANYPAVIAPEQTDMTDVMVAQLKTYVKQGGVLMISGAGAYDRFGGAFLGATKGSLENDTRYYVPAAKGCVPVYSAETRLCKQRKDAQGYGFLGTSPRVDERLTKYPAAIVNRVEAGAVVYIPYDIFKFFDRSHYILVRKFIGELTASVLGKLPITVSGPSCIDVVLRKRGRRRIIHLINRASGMANRPNDGAVDEIPCVGPAEIEMQLEQKPENVELVFENGSIAWKFIKKGNGGILKATVSSIHIHTAVVVEC